MYHVPSTPSKFAVLTPQQVQNTVNLIAHMKATKANPKLIAWWENRLALCSVTKS